MEAVTTQDQQALLAQLAQDSDKLDSLVRDLRAVDDELHGLATEREQHRLLHDACGALEALRGMGGAELFWGAGAAADVGQDRIRDARSRAEAFEQRIGEIEGRRRGLLEQIEQQQERNYLLEDELFEAQEAEEQRLHEWIVDREIDVLPAAAAPLPWMRGGEDDRRFRKSLAATLLFSLIFALILPSIVLPLLPANDEPVKVPDRVVRMMMEKRPVPPAPPPVAAPSKPQEQLAKLKPAEQAVPQKPAKPDKQEPVKAPGENPAEAAKPAPEKGLLAFRQELDALKDSENVANLGLNAHIRNSDDNASGRPQRAMLTTNARGSSGGINLASLSKGLNGGSRDGGSGGMAGVQVTRATSGIGGGGGAGASDRPLAGGGIASRTDEEIQIVFDRYKASLYRLYNRELRKDPSLRGQMVLRLTIEPDGRVSMCQLHASDMNAPELAAQVVDRVLTINFGAKDVAAITILYPIDFLPAA